MTLDPITAAELVDREVRTGTREGVPTRIVLARRTYATDPADLWDAVTDPERLARWFLPVTGELRPGGRYQLQGNAAGTIQACDEPERIALTWEYAGQVSWLELTLTRAPRGTTLQVTHEVPVDDDFWAQYGPGATGIGWDLGLVGLGWHLEPDAPAEPPSADDWAVTDAGIAFVRRAATGWADAATADGDEVASARAAADNTVRFYTVAPEA